MFSKELENLIQATLEDGVLEKYEEEALIKRAQAEGVDITELKIYINSILQKRQKERKEALDAKIEEIEQKKKENLGRICPKCGRPVPPMTLTCANCGFEISEQKHISSVQLFSEQLNSIKLTDAEIESCKHTDLQNNIHISQNEMNDLLEQKKLQLIQTFPVPNTKEDIMEFLALAAPNSKIKGGLLGSRKGRLKLAIITGTIIFVVGLSLSLFLSSSGPRWYAREYGGEIRGIGLGVTLIACVFAIIVCFKTGTDVLKENKKAKVWRAKFDQVLMKGRSLRADAEFTQMLDYYENIVNKK